MVAFVAKKSSVITLTDGLPLWLWYHIFDNCGKQFGPEPPTDEDLIFALIGCDPVQIATHTTPLQHSFGKCKAAAVSVSKENAAVVENLKASLPQESLIEWADHFVVLTIAPWRPKFTPIFFGYLNAK